MTEYEIKALSLQQLNLLIGLLYLLATLLLAVVAIWGERIRQLWTRPKLHLALVDPTFTSHTGTNKKAWYYHLRVSNTRRTSPAQNVRVLLTNMLKRGPDGSWQEQKSTGPIQVLWRWAHIPQFATVGPDEHATFGCIAEDDDAFLMKLIVYPNNLQARIPANDATRLQFKAVSDTAESNTIRIDLAWDGLFEYGSSEMSRHMVMKEVNE